MKALALIIASALALAGCTTTIDQQLQKTAPQICAAADTSHALFLVAVRTGEIKTKYVDQEAALYARIQVLCADPANINALSVLVVAADAYASLKNRAEKDK